MLSKRDVWPLGNLTADWKCILAQFGIYQAPHTFQARAKDWGSEAGTLRWIRSGWSGNGPWWAAFSHHHSAITGSLLPPHTLETLLLPLAPPHLKSLHQELNTFSSLPILYPFIMLLILGVHRHLIKVLCWFITTSSSWSISPYLGTPPPRLLVFKKIFLKYHLTCSWW